MRIIDLKPTNFIYPEIKDTHYRFGSGKISGIELRPNGDWRDYLPPTEDQNIRGIESSACYIEAQQHAIATILEEQFDVLDQNYSARFNALLSNGTDSGGDPLKGGDSIRHDGLVPEAAMPFGNDIQSWSDFHSWKGVVEQTLRNLGKQFLSVWVPKYDVVFEKGEPLIAKYDRLREALKYSPCPISVSAWFEENGEYYKPKGSKDNHLVVAVYLDDKNRIYIRDSYAPYEKILSPNYNCDFCMRWSVTKNDVQSQITILTQIRDYCLDVINLFLQIFQKKIT